MLTCLEDLEKRQRQSSHGTGLVDIHESKLSSDLRPLEAVDKVLNSELKYLYTAITRARQHVWVFDEDTASRTPMFEYFRRRGLVTMATFDENGKVNVPEIFTQVSSAEEWNQRGMIFYNRQMWKAALQCFEMSHNWDMMNKCNAQLREIVVRQLQHSNSKKTKRKYLCDAEKYMSCQMLQEAAICLHNAREFLLQARLEVKLENVSERF